MQSSLAPFTPSEGYIVLCGNPTQLAPVRALPLYVYRGQTTPRARFHRLCTIVDFDQAGSDGTRFHTLFGQTVQLSGDRGQLAWSQTRRPTCLPAEENGRLDTSKYVVATNDLCKRLNYERLASFSPVLDVHACGCDDSNDERADDDDTPKRRKYGPHSRLRDEMETKENVVGSTLDDEERITFVPSPHSLLLTVCLITIHKFTLAVTIFHVARRDHLLDGGRPVRST